MTTDNQDNAPEDLSAKPAAPVETVAAPAASAAAPAATKKNRSSMYIVLGILGVVALFIISAIVNTWSAVKSANTAWKPSAVFSSGSKNDDAIVALDVDGVIFDSVDLLDAIQQISEDDKIKGVILRVNTPGGAVAPTQEILSALHRLTAEKKTIYCSFADIAASGGYYLATACSKIFTNPGTITGSIGVIMPFANLQELYKFIKVEPMLIKAGRFKDIGSESRPMTADERILLQNMADEIHRQFKTAVKDARKLGDEVIQEYADGRIFLGSQAIDYGFADELGGEYEATDALAKVLKVEAPTTLSRFPVPEPEYRSFFGILSSLMKPETRSPSEARQILEWIGAKAPQLSPRLSSGVPYFLPYTWFGAHEAAKAR